LQLSGNSYISLHGTSAGRTLENLFTVLTTVMIRILAFFQLFICKKEILLEKDHSYTASEQQKPQTLRKDDMSACLQRIRKLESLCNHLMSKPPDMPKEKELVLLESLDRIKSLEGELEITKKVSCFFLLITLYICMIWMS